MIKQKSKTTTMHVAASSIFGKDFIINFYSFLALFLVIFLKIYLTNEIIYMNDTNDMG